ncbi:MAG: phosphoesterase PA-phosphatase, partial [Chitinophagaceae bacterium]|nr:phosphoesterase PA-phosphatase [Chitinophagaceae bacterium]
MKVICSVLALCLLLISCKEKGNPQLYASDPMLFCKTVKSLNDVVLENNFPPMIASRNYAYATIAAYECVVAGDSSYTSLAGQVKHMPQMPRPIAGKQIDYSLAALLAFTKVGNAVTFPEGSMMGYYQSLTAAADSAGIAEEVLHNTIQFSDSIVNAVMAWSKKDNYAQLRTASRYTVIDTPGRWVPTPPSYTSGVEPHWMEIRPFVMDSASQCKPVVAPIFDIKNISGSFYKAMMEVKNVGDSLT